METQSALVGSDRAVKLYTVSLVYLHISLIIHPRNLEGNNSFRLCKTLQNTGLAIFLFVCINHQL